MPRTRPPNVSSTPQTSQEPKAPVVVEEATYIYEDADCRPVLRVDRVKWSDGHKEFPQFRPNGRDGWIAGVKGYVDEPPPYRLPKILTAIEQRLTIYVVEGEKCADALSALGFTAALAAPGSFCYFAILGRLA